MVIVIISRTGGVIMGVVGGVVIVVMVDGTGGVVVKMIGKARV